MANQSAFDPGDFLKAIIVSFDLLEGRGQVWVNEKNRERNYQDRNLLFPFGLGGWRLPEVCLGGKLSLPLRREPKRMERIPDTGDRLIVVLGIHKGKDKVSFWAYLEDWESQDLREWQREVLQVTN